MAGWSHSKREKVERAFYQYLDQCYVNSKDLGRICLGEHLFYGQRLFITTVFDALEDDIHKIYVLKSRQLGLSTIARALAIFLLGVHPGIKGAIVFDTDQNRTEARADLETMIEDLPPALKFPEITGNNRAGLTLKNDSKVLFFSAGVRKSKTSGTLGRSMGLSLALLSELCSYDNEEGLEAFENSLSEINPDRLYIYESTARGYNQWNLIWEQAVEDSAHCAVLFLGWWSKSSQKIDQDHPDFALYGTFPPTEKEAKKIAEVKELYDYDITVEQLAWIRRKMDPASKSQGDADPQFEGNPTRVQEQPWTADDAWQMTGSAFFASENLTDLTNKHVSDDFQTYMYHCGAEFADMRIYKADNVKSVELKVWEEPDHDGVYVIGIDPAYGENEHNCRSSIEVLRCYADGIDQVAEYAWPLVTTRQLSWAIASLLGWYGAGRGQVRYILELNGPGQAVLNSLKDLKFQIENGYQFEKLDAKGLRDIFRNVSQYIYSRVDAIGTGHNYHFKTDTQRKILIMERLRDFASNGNLRVRSMELIKEMKSISRDGDSIGAPSSMKDDRVVAIALASYYWETKIRRDLIVRKMTRDSEAAKKRMSIVDQVTLFNQNNLAQFFAGKRMERITAARDVQRQRWRYGRG
jgi:hypothetical protein